MQAQTRFTQDLWKGKPAVKSTDKKDTARVDIFLPPAEKATGRAVVILPGGGYTWLAMDNEGYGWTQFFNKLGIAAVVVKYRMPHGKPTVPVSDAEEAIRLVRRNAAKWHIDARQVGIMGSSAGGHLASTVATQAKSDARPDFQILFYPVISMDPQLTHMGSHDNLLGKKVKKIDEAKYSSDVQASRLTPRAFITFASDDSLVNPENGVNYYLQLYRNDVPATVCIFPEGEHGYGSQTSFRYHNQLLMEMESWLRSF
ncbi:MAG: alpha/beta hydrolase [Prevotella sp.]|nr:alpha/beta hydrolase [Prevotella sp.]